MLYLLLGFGFYILFVYLISLKILNKQKEYRNQIPKEDKARAKIIYYLNNDKEYKNKIKPQTVSKYDIKLVDGVWV